jgi:hypothetical protein
MATCDTLEVDLSPPPPINITLQQYPCIDVEVLQSDITIEAVTLANQGPKGDQGPAGSVGPIGPAGPQGVQGVAGPQGVAGAQGQQGDLGPQGTTGPPGPTGATGGTGPTGPQGPAGLQGNPGAAATIAVGTTATGAPGSNASVSNSGSSSAAVFNFTIPAGIQGPIGPQGPSGSGTGDMLKSVYDTNSNNIVDAAESVPWAGVTGKPATFSPSPHANTHLSAGSDPIAIATSVLAGLCPAVDNTTIQVVASKLSAVALAWTAITGKPATFPATPHASSHVTGGTDIIPAPTTSASGLVPALPASAGASKFFDGTGAFNQVAYANVTGTPTVPAPSSTTPIMDGAAAVGTGTTYARNDHVHPSDTSRMAVGAAPTAHQASHVTGSDQIPLASVSTKGLLNQTSGLTTDFIDGTNNSQPLQPVIWSARLRSFNAIGNPNFEVDQRNVGNALTNPATGIFAQDRWQVIRVGTMGINTLQSVAAITGRNLFVPGTTFGISNNFLVCTLTAQETTLAAGDLWIINQNIEGALLRELLFDVSSISLLVASSVANLKFSVAIRDPATITKSLVKLCTIPNANTWTLIPLPNLSVFPAGNFSVTPGQLGYMLSITLACGSTFTAPAADSWQNGNFVAAPGMSNFAASPVNATFQIAFVQHEPGPLCTTLIDKPFSQNHDECLRYFSKTYDYGVKPGTVTGAPVCSIASQGNADIAGWIPFVKRIAKSPAGGIGIYNHSTGAIQSIQTRAATNIAVNSINNLGESGFGGLTLASAPAANMPCYFHYVADTGW